MQDVSQIPDIFVEGYNDDNKYTRWKFGIDSLEVVFSDHDDSGKYFSSEIAKEEPIEFVHGENFYDLIFIHIIKMKHKYIFCCVILEIPQIYN